MVKFPKTYSDFLSILNPKEKLFAPKELFFEGDFNLISTHPKVSIVGSRDVTEEGRRRTEIITKALVDRQIIVVSGLAKGVDTIAHKTTIKYGGKTIAVLGTPLDKCYPAENKNLLDEIKKNHLAISQFQLGSRVFQSNFPDRNKTMALISDATIIIEASEKSGTRHQAWEAIRLNRTVFLMENIVNGSNITWVNDLIKYGALVLSRENYNLLFDELQQYSFIAA